MESWYVLIDSVQVVETDSERAGNPGRRSLRLACLGYIMSPFQGSRGLREEVPNCVLIKYHS